MSKEHLLPYKVRGVLGTLTLIAALNGCGGTVPSSSSASPDNTFSPVPTETAMPTPTASPTLEPTPTLTPTSRVPTRSPEQIHSITWKPGDVITSGPPDGTIYLTFDDCWQDIGPVVETAHKMGAKITFFCIGQAIRNVSGQSASLKLAESYGDDLENHTDTHPYMTNVTDVQYVKNQIEAQSKSLRDALGEPNYKEVAFRLPGGDGENNPAVQEAAREEHLAIVHWSIDSGGTSDAYTTTDARIQTLMNTVNAGLFKDGNLVGGSILLQHVRPADEKALPLIIQEIKDKGGSFGLISDLITGSTALYYLEPQPTQPIISDVFAKKEDELMAA